MPKDPTRNQPNYKIGGDHLNEYDFEKSKGSMTEQKENLSRQPDQDEIEPAGGRGSQNRSQTSSGSANS